MSTNETMTAQSLDAQHKPLKKPTAPIVLRAPTHSDKPGAAFSKPGTYWSLSHSSRPGWKVQRNMLIRCETSKTSSVANSTSDQQLEVSYAKKSSSERASEIVGSGWEVLGEGRYGALEDWMVETEYGIEDSAGEVRPDWRPWYLVLYFPSGDSRGEGVDLLTTRVLSLPDDFAKEVEAALEKSCGLKAHLLPVTTDADFKIPPYKYVESAPQVWNNPDIYGDEQSSSSRTCIVQ